MSEYWKLSIGNYIVKFKKYDRLDGDNDAKKIFPCHLGGFLWSHSKKILNIFFREINGFYNKSICYGETDSLYIEKRYWDVNDKANLLGGNLCQGKNNYETGGIFDGLFPAPTVK